MPQTGARGSGVLELIEDGAYLTHRWRHLYPAPDATWIIGSDESTETCSALYNDECGVSRVYQMTFDGGVWRFWRNAPGFNQRFTGTLDGASTSIRGSMEMSDDGFTWKHDFDLIYGRPGSGD